MFTTFNVSAQNKLQFTAGYSMKFPNTVGDNSLVGSGEVMAFGSDIRIESLSMQWGGYGDGLNAEVRYLHQLNSSLSWIAGLRYFRHSSAPQSVYLGSQATEISRPATFDYRVSWIDESNFFNRSVKLDFLSLSTGVELLTPLNQANTWEFYASMQITLGSGIYIAETHSYVESGGSFELSATPDGRFKSVSRGGLSVGYLVDLGVSKPLGKRSAVRLGIQSLNQSMVASSTEYSVRGIGTWTVDSQQSISSIDGTPAYRKPLNSLSLQLSYLLNL